MGGLCTVSATPLPDYKETVGQTQLPGFVAAGGKEIYEPRCQEHHNYMRS